jgi:hypothetical protein
MQETLAQSPEYTLTLEKTAGQWWLELVDRATGRVQIIYFTNKQKAKAFFDRMELSEVKAFCDHLKVPVVAMYKPNVM